MDYTKLLETISEIVNNDRISKVGLTLVYDLPPDQHNLLNKEVFYKLNPKYVEFTPSDVFEVEISGVLIKFNIKK